MPIFLLPFLSGIKTVWSMALEFFSKPPGLYVGIVLLILGSGWWYGHHEYNKGKADQIASEVKAGEKKTQTGIAITATIHDQGVVREAHIEEVASETKKVIPLHVTKKADAACPVSNGFVSVFNTTAQGAVPPSDTRNDDTASGITLSDIARVTAENDAAYAIVSSRLVQWQEWYVQQKENWDRR